jgi:hypothetical protein
MNITMYVLSFAVFLNFLLTLIAIARVAKWRKDLAGLDWEAVATLLGDVATVKRSIVRLNGRLNGMDSPKYDVEQEINAALMKQQAAPQKARGG